MSTTRTTASTATRRTARHQRAWAAGAAFLAAGLMVGCSAVGPKDAVKASPTTKPAAPATTSAPTAGPSTTVASGGVTATPAGTDQLPTSPAPQADPQPQPQPQANPRPQPQPQPSAPKPVITGFHTPENIDCHNDDYPYFTASWTTTNAVKVTISIDGPGIYKTYPANGSDSLPFSCSTSHSFLLTAFGADGHTVTRQITLQPRNVRPPASPDDDQVDPADQ